VGAVIAPVFELFFNNSKFSPNHSKTKHGVLQNLKILIKYEEGGAGILSAFQFFQQNH
jgi:hypothetical protein